MVLQKIKGLCDTFHIKFLSPLSKRVNFSNKYSEIKNIFRIPQFFCWPRKWIIPSSTRSEFLMLKFLVCYEMLELVAKSSHMIWSAYRISMQDIIITYRISQVFDVFAKSGLKMIISRLLRSENSIVMIIQHHSGSKKINNCWQTLYLPSRALHILFWSRCLLVLLQDWDWDCLGQITWSLIWSTKKIGDKTSINMCWCIWKRQLHFTHLHFRYGQFLDYNDTLISMKRWP